MIEKFTKEELAIIKRELKEQPKAQMKRYVCEQPFRRLRKIFEPRPNYSGISGSNWEMEDYILNLTDHILANYTKRSSYRYKGTLCRNNNVPNGMMEEYIETVNDIVNVIEKHFVEKMEEKE